MQFATLAVSALFGFAAAQIPSKPCSHLTGGVHVIAAGGEGDANPPYGLIGSLAQGILKAIPGSSNISLPYDHDQVNGVTQTQDGVRRVLFQAMR